MQEAPQQVGRIIEQNQKSQTTRQEKPSCKHSDEKFIFVWRGLQAAKFLTKDEVVGGTEYKYWKQMLGDLTDEQLLGGFRATENFHGYMTWAEFKKLCADSSIKNPAHTPFSRRLGIKPLGAKELRRRIEVMREELAL